jgi:hypothetical protein
VLRADKPPQPTADHKPPATEIQMPPGRVMILLVLTIGRRV